MSNSIKKVFHSEPVHNKKCLETKIKSYEGTIYTNFYDIGIPKEDSQCVCL